jgi:hypothetical protein
MDKPSDNSPDRIRITADEVARVDAGPAEAARSTASVPRLHPAAGLLPRSWIVAAAATLLFLAVGAVLVSVLLRPGGDNIDEFAQHWRAQQTQELTQSPDVKAYIEGTHPLVTFKGANVGSVELTTCDGSQNAGSNGSNVSEIDFVVTYYWRGPVQENGHTVVRHLLDFPSKQMKDSKIIETTALVTIDDASLTQLGMFLVPLLLGEN